MTKCVSDRDYHCATHDRQWMDDESDRCEYKRMVEAEATIRRVRDECRFTLATTDYDTVTNAVTNILRALDGEAPMQRAARILNTPWPLLDGDDD